MNVFGARIHIRPTRHEDLAFLRGVWNDGTVMREKGYPHGMGVDASGMERWWVMTPQAGATRTSAPSLQPPHCVIELLDGTPIGELTYTLDAQQRAVIDLKLAAAYWGRGLATEALEAVMRELFATTPVRKVVMEPPAVGRATRLLQRCGFRPAPTENHPARWECAREDFADRIAGSGQFADSDGLSASK